MGPGGMPEPGPDRVTYAAEHDTAPAAGPGGSPQITIRVKVEIGGQWVTPDMIAWTARELAATIAAQLRAAADEEPGAIADARATRDHMARWAEGTDTHPGEGMIP
jgi:hypothetical protein